MKTLLFTLISLVLIGCGVDTEPDVTIGDMYFFYARCDIQNSSSQDIVCIEYTNTSPAPSYSDCSLAETQFGGSSINFTTAVGTPGCTSSNRVGRCETSDAKIHFYNTKYTAGGAQTECNSLGGTFY